LAVLVWSDAAARRSERGPLHGQVRHAIIVTSCRVCETLCERLIVHHHHQSRCLLSPRIVSPRERLWSAALHQDILPSRSQVASYHALQFVLRCPDSTCHDNVCIDVAFPRFSFFSFSVFELCWCVAWTWDQAALARCCGSIALLWVNLAPIRRSMSACIAGE
jgi:hypothetical protein